MSDIVEKLRKLRTPYEYPSTVYKEAADEIDRLRVLVKDAYFEGFEDGRCESGSLFGDWGLGDWKRSSARRALDT